MAEPMPDFTLGKGRAVTRSPLERCIHAHPAYARAIKRLPGDGSTRAAGDNSVSI